MGLEMFSCANAIWFWGFCFASLVLKLGSTQGTLTKPVLVALRSAATHNFMLIL